MNKIYYALIYFLSMYIISILITIYVFIYHKNYLKKTYDESMIRTAFTLFIGLSFFTVPFVIIGYPIVSIKDYFKKK